MMEVSEARDSTHFYDNTLLSGLCDKKYLRILGYGVLKITTESKITTECYLSKMGSNIVTYTTYTIVGKIRFPIWSFQTH